MIVDPRECCISAEELIERYLLGGFVCRRFPDGSTGRFRITECEAYLGTEDTACHAYRGRTPGNEVLWADGGRAYVCNSYGHLMLNIVAGEEGDPQCVLVRSVFGVSGPGRVSKALSLVKSMNGAYLVPENGLWLETDDRFVPNESEQTPRIGIPYADGKDRDALLNYRLLSIIDPETGYVPGDLSRGP